MAWWAGCRGQWVGAGWHKGENRKQKAESRNGMEAEKLKKLTLQR
jgi:hypothetical protein